MLGGLQVGHFKQGLVRVLDSADAETELLKVRSDGRKRVSKALAAKIKRAWDNGRGGAPVSDSLSFICLLSGKIDGFLGLLLLLLVLGCSTALMDGACICVTI